MTDRTTAEQVPPAPLALVPVPGLQAIGGDAVGVCGPDGCSPVDPGRQPSTVDVPRTDSAPTRSLPTDRVP